MMRESRRLPFGLGLRYPYQDYFDRQRAIGLLYLMLAVGIMVMFLAINTFLSSVLNNIPFSQLNLLILGLTLVFSLFITYLVQIGLVRIASQLVVILTFVIAFLAVEELTLTSWATLNVLVIVSAGLLLNRLWLLFMAVAVILNLLRIALLTATSLGEVISLGYSTTILIISLITVYFYLFSSLFQMAIRREIEGNEQMIAVGHFMKRISRKSEEAVMNAVLNFIRDDLRYNFAQLFFVDDDTGLLTTRLRIGVGGVGDTLRTDVRVNDTSALMQALRTEEAVFINNTDSEFRRDHFLPATKFGVALPIKVRDEVIAVLDIQDNTGRFTKMRMNALQLLAEELSIVLEDITTINALRQVLNEQSVTLDNLRRQLREYKQYEKQVVGGVWDEYLQGRGYEAIGFDLTQTDTGVPQLTPSFDLTDDLATIMATKEIHVESNAEGHTIFVPIILRGEILGALRFVMPPDTPPSERQLDLIQDVVSRLALALENKRLFEQSQSQALRERKANEVARELIGATEVRDVLSLAAQMFTNTLGAVHTRIELQPDVMKAGTTLTTETPAVTSDTSSERGITPDV